MSIRTSVLIAAGVLFAAATVWINYEVKVNIQEAASSGAVDELGSVKIGQMAPGFSAPDLTGHTVNLSDFQSKKVVVVDFWATWCGPCRMAMPGLQNLLTDLQGRGLEILSVDEGESASVAGTYISQKNYGFHVLLDPSGTIGHQYGVRGIPTLVIIDKTGIVRRIRVGFQPSEDDLRKVIEKYLDR